MCVRGEEERVRGSLFSSILSNLGYNTMFNIRGTETVW